MLYSFCQSRIQCPSGSSSPRHHHTCFKASCNWRVLHITMWSQLQSLPICQSITNIVVQILQHSLIVISWLLCLSIWGKGLACLKLQLYFCEQSNLWLGSYISKWTWCIPPATKNRKLQLSRTKYRKKPLFFFLFWVQCKKPVERGNMKSWNNQLLRDKKLTSSTSISISSHFRALTIKSNLIWWALFWSFCFWII